MVEMVAKVIRSDDDGHPKVQIAIPKVSKAGALEPKSIEVERGA